MYIVTYIYKNRERDYRMFEEYICKENVCDCAYMHTHAFTICSR